MPDWYGSSGAEGGRSARHVTGTLLLGMMLALGGSAGAVAQEPAPPAEGASPAEPAAETTFLSKVSIHGFLSQAYAFSDGHQILGIPDQGTFDYNTSALLIRADMTEDDAFSIQFSHERNGESPTQKGKPDVKLDWAFYEHHFGSSAVKVGRVKIPYGIYNEVRDVGTVLPLYRPARDFYGEGSFTTETVDGLLLSHHFEMGPSWTLSADLYGGNWTLSDTNGLNTPVEKTFGGQVFLDTPVRGLRLGGGFIRFNAGAAPTRPASYWHDYHLSLQENIGRFEADVEYKKEKADLQKGGKNLYDIVSWMARIGFHVTDKLTAHVQREQFDLGLPSAHFDNTYDAETVGALTYRLRPDLVVKGEYHWNKGYYTEPAGNIFGPKQKTNYGILSLSASF